MPSVSFRSPRPFQQIAGRHRGLPSLLLFLVALIVAVGPAGAEPRGFDVRDLVALDRAHSPVLSANGMHLVFAVREIDPATGSPRTGLWHRNLMTRDQRPPQRLTPEDFNVNSPAFGADGAVYFLSSHSGSMQLWSQQIGAVAPVRVTDYALDVGSFKLSPDGSRVALSLEVFPECQSLACTRQRLDATSADKASGQLYEQLFVRHWDFWKDGRLNQLFVARLVDGQAQAEPTRIGGLNGDVPARPFGDSSDYAWSPDGNSLAVSVRPANAEEPWSTNFDIWLASVDGRGAPVNLTADNPAWDAGPVFSGDGKTLYYRAMKRPGYEADRFAAMALEFASGQRRELSPRFDQSLESLALAPDGKALLAQALEQGRRSLFAIDLALGEVALVAGGGNIGAFDAAGQVLAFTRDSLTSPAQVFTAPLSGEPVRQISELNGDRLENVVFGDYEQFHFIGWNDETVYGYVIKPWNFQAGEHYPVAFLIHGGPQGSFSNNFHYRWNPQTYAGAGFAVVVIDFHGSTGYGQAFTDAINGDWGGKPLVDLRKGWAAALEKYPFLDGDRACALGGSYGGYMVNWIAGNWSEPWQCLVNHDGIFDNRMMYYTTEELWFPEWEHGGPHFKNPSGYERHNPVAHVSSWRVPMLVIQGQNDFRVPLEQGLATFTALQRRGIPSQFLYFPNENHWVLKPENSVLWHDTVNAWLRRWTEPNRATP